MQVLQLGGAAVKQRAAALPRESEPARGARFRQAVAQVPAATPLFGRWWSQVPIVEPRQERGWGLEPLLSPVPPPPELDGS